MDPFFDGKGIEYHHLQRNQQLNAQKQTNKLLEEAAKARAAEEAKPQCPHCGGRLPGRFTVCAHCKRDLHWGHTHTRSPFATDGEAQRNILEVNKRNQESRAAANAIAAERVQHERAEKSRLSRYGILLRSPALAMTGFVLAVVFLIYLGGQYWHEPNSDRIAQLWQAAAFAGFAMTSLAGPQCFIPPLVMAAVFFVQAGCMAYFGMPMWLYGPVIVTGLTALFAALPDGDEERTLSSGGGG